MTQHTQPFFLLALAFHRIHKFWLAFAPWQNLGRSHDESRGVNFVLLTLLGNVQGLNDKRWQKIWWLHCKPEVGSGQTRLVNPVCSCGAMLYPGHHAGADIFQPWTQCPACWWNRSSSRSISRFPVPCVVFIILLALGNSFRVVCLESGDRRYRRCKPRPEVWSGFGMF